MNVTISLPSIQKIYMVKCADIAPNILEKHLSGLPVGIYPLPEEVEQYGTGSCVAEQEYEDGSLVETATLQFDTAQEIPGSNGMAFVVGDNNGKYYIIGRKEKPYPAITVNKNIGTESTYNTVKVVFKSRKALIPCFI